VVRDVVVPAYNISGRGAPISARFLACSFLTIRISHHCIQLAHGRCNAPCAVATVQMRATRSAVTTGWATLLGDI
jgi:hypothetical protein